MPAIVLVGAQWGDEGKGKATDLLGSRVDYVVKFNGGNNAGHTVVIGDEKYALHLLPVRHPHARRHRRSSATASSSTSRCSSRSSTRSTARGVDVSQAASSAPTRTSSRSYHRTLDKVTERFLGKRQIGTTGRGIGPTYADKINRVGIRIQDLFDENILRQKVEGGPRRRRTTCWSRSTTAARSSVDEIVDELLSYADRLRPMVADTGARAEPGARRRRDRAVRGRPGDHARRRPRHLPVRHVVATPPPAAPCTGSGVPPTASTASSPIVKAYTTRVGAGPFPTELHDDVRRVPAQDRLRVRHDHRPPAPLRLVRRRRSPATRRASTASPTSCSPSSTCSPASRDPGLRRLRRRRRAPRRGAGQRRPTSTTRRRSTRSSPAGPRTSPACRTFEDLPQTPRTTCSRSRRSSAPGSRPSASAPAATRSSCGSRSSRPSRG